MNWKQVIGLLILFLSAGGGFIWIMLGNGFFFYSSMAIVLYYVLFWDGKLNTQERSIYRGLLLLVGIVIGLVYFVWSPAGFWTDLSGLFKDLILVLIAGCLILAGILSWNSAQASRYLK